MSYCRTGEDSDVYVYPREDGIVCSMCPMIGSDLVASSPLNMLTHLLGHTARDQKVPRVAFERLMHEAGVAGAPRSHVFQAYKRLPLGVQAVLDRLDALPIQWRERAQRSNVSADELDMVLIDLHMALDEWIDL